MAIDIKKLVAALKSKRTEEGLSLRKLAAEIGVSFSTLARIERGDGEPDNNSTLRIIEWLGSDAEELGIGFDNVAMVHFRAAKNVSSKTIECLLSAANHIKIQHYNEREQRISIGSEGAYDHEVPQKALSLSKTEMEQMAESLRSDLDIDPSAQLPALNIRIQGVTVQTPEDLVDFSQACLKHLVGKGAAEWSAMSVPLEEDKSLWSVFHNKNHTIERQRVTYLEECWHILLGHRLTKVAKIAGAYGRTYESTEEHDAFYLASATLMPQEEIIKRVSDGESAQLIGEHFGTSPELVEYRIKRLGLWRVYKGLRVDVSSDQTIS